MLETQSPSSQTAHSRHTALAPATRTVPASQTEKVKRPRSLPESSAHQSQAWQTVSVAYVQAICTHSPTSHWVHSRQTVSSLVSGLHGVTSNSPSAHTWHAAHSPPSSAEPSEM